MFWFYVIWSDVKVIIKLFFAYTIEVNIVAGLVTPRLPGVNDSVVIITSTSGLYVTYRQEVSSEYQS